MQSLMIHDLAVGGISSYFTQLTSIYALLHTVSEHLGILTNKYVVPQLPSQISCSR